MYIIKDIGIDTSPCDDAIQFYFRITHEIKLVAVSHLYDNITWQIRTTNIGFHSLN